jgi:hypothetical protein
MSERSCCICGRLFAPSNRQNKYCRECRRGGSIVYRYICPDGRSYVGAVAYDGHLRNAHGIKRSNARLLDAFKQYPPATWTFEVLERRPLEYSLREAEQRHIDRLRSWDPAAGFNMHPAIEGPSAKAARHLYREAHRAWQAVTLGKVLDLNNT